MNKEDIEIKKDSYLNGINGTKSSKRLLGMLMLASSLIYGLILGLYAIQNKITNPDVCTDILQLFILGGCTLLGVGIFETKRNIK